MARCLKSLPYKKCPGIWGVWTREDKTRQNDKLPKIFESFLLKSGKSVASDVRTRTNELNFDT